MLITFNHGNEKIFFWTHMKEISIDKLNYKLNKEQIKLFKEIFPGVEEDVNHTEYFKYKREVLQKFILSIIKDSSGLRDYLVITDL